jgi:hypothetical protein
VEPKIEQPTDMGRHAALVAAGILLSRIAGLIRDRVFAHYFGNSRNVWCSLFRSGDCFPPTRGERTYDQGYRFG